MLAKYPYNLTHSKYLKNIRVLCQNVVQIDFNFANFDIKIAGFYTKTPSFLPVNCKFSKLLN
jgi:hypothetical protein